VAQTVNIQEWWDAADYREEHFAPADPEALTAKLAFLRSSASAMLGMGHGDRTLIVTVAKGIFQVNYFDGNDYFDLVSDEGIAGTLCCDLGGQEVYLPCRLAVRFESAAGSAEEFFRAGMIDTSKGWIPQPQSWDAGDDQLRWRESSAPPLSLAERLALRKAGKSPPGRQTRITIDEWREVAGVPCKVLRRYLPRSADEAVAHVHSASVSEWAFIVVEVGGRLLVIRKSFALWGASFSDGRSFVKLGPDQSDGTVQFAELGSLGAKPRREIITLDDVDTALRQFFGTGNMTLDSTWQRWYPADQTSILWEKTKQRQDRQSRKPR